MRQRVFPRIAANLKRRIETDTSFVLPSISELCDEYAVAYNTMWKAVQQLVCEGMLVSLPGRKIVLARDVDRGGLAGSVEKLAAGLRRRIEAGDYKVGQPLPKIDYFAVSGRVSHTTVTRALRRLARDNLVHRRRKRWVAGPAPELTSPPHLQKRSTDVPVVLVLFNDEADWSYVVGTPFLAGFLMPFMSELFDHGVLVEPCFRFHQGDLRIGVPTGMEEILSRARALGPRYLGALTLTVHPDDNLAHHMVSLLTFKRPVVFFDSAEQGAWLTRRHLSAGTNYYRMHQDETAAVSLALRALTSAGHRTIGIHQTSFGGWWSERRTKAFKSLARKTCSGTEIMTVQSEEGFWGFANMTSLHEFLSAVARQVSPDHPPDVTDTASVRRIRRLLVEKAPEFASLLSNNRTTALVGLSDRMAREYHFWLRAFDVRIPSHLSLIAFDNFTESAFFPISTIDWGFGRLGYLAAHAFIGDMHIRADRQGSFPGVCKIADRGSVGKPGDPRTLARMLRV